MSYLSMTNVFMKTQHRFLQESTTANIAQTRNLLLTPNNNNNNNNNNNPLLNNNEKIQQVWSNYNFDINNIDNNFNNNKLKMSWTINCNNNNNNDDEINKMQETEHDTKPISLLSNNKEKEATSAIVTEEIPPLPPSSPINNEEKEESSSSSPSHHARRPPNAFLIFCKKHRPIVRSKYPSLENRGVTKILGEWWALLNDNDKAPYTQLAKEYKDAFLSANPDFKWYKLPAPPLRTLNVRPNNNNNNSCNVHHKVPSPIPSPVLGNLQTESEFTPGKLADESQLGNLTALMSSNNNNNNCTTITPKTTIINENDDNNNDDSIEKSPVNFIRTHLPPPAPIKKRISQKYLDNRKIARNLMENISGGEFCNNDNQDDDDNQLEEHNGNDNYDDNSNNMTTQELMDKVVDKLFTKNGDYDNNHHHLDVKHSKEIVRKSGRQCKGKRYEKFMSEGRLLGNKRDNNTKLSNNNNNNNNNGNRNNNEYDEKIENETIETPNLDHTIKRLAERTNMKGLLLTETNQSNEITNDNLENNNDINTKNNNAMAAAPTTTTPKTANGFNLDLRISLLPSLSYEVYSQRKKDSKKRKNRIRPNNNNNNNNNPSDAKIPKLARNEQLVGSKKRKNKSSITHLENKQEQPQDDNNDLLGLATLAEVAANTEKINDISQ